MQLERPSTTFILPHQMKRQRRLVRINVFMRQRLSTQCVVNDSLEPAIVRPGKPKGVHAVIGQTTTLGMEVSDAPRSGLLDRIPSCNLQSRSTG